MSVLEENPELWTCTRFSTNCMDKNNEKLEMFSFPPLNLYF